MGRGELQPKRITKYWKWLPRLYPGKDKEAEAYWVPQRLSVQNRYIQQAAVLMRERLNRNMALVRFLRKVSARRKEKGV